MARDPRKDFASSIAVALVAIPLCLGIAQASGAPLLAGLLSGIVGGCVVGSLSSSQLSVTGPAAGLTTLVLGGLAKLGSFPAFLTATVVAGFFQMLLGKLRAGTLSRLFPSCVIKGMLAAIGLTLIFKQFPHLIGFDLERFGVMEYSDNPSEVDPSAGASNNTFSLLWKALNHIEPTACAIGVICLAVLYGWEARFQKKLPTVPGSLIAVIVGIVINVGLGLFAPEHALGLSHLVQIPALSTGVLTFPDFSALANPAVYSVALTIALIASVESLLTVEALDRLDPQHRVTPPNRELVAQGVGNMCCGLIGGTPVTSVVVRGTVNLSAGATSKYSTMFHGCWLILALLVLRPGLNQIPLASLAAILVQTGFKLAHPSLLKKMMKRGYSQGIPYLATILTVLFSDLLIGIMVGTLVSALFILHNLYRSRGFHLEQEGDTTQIRFHQEVTFFHKVHLTKLFESLPEGSRVEIDATQARRVDADVLDTLEVFKERAPQRNIEVQVGGLHELVGAVNGSPNGTMNGSAATHEKTRH